MPPRSDPTERAPGEPGEEEDMRNALPTSTEFIVLQLLRDNPKGRYGLELVKESDGKLKRGTVYVILSRLEDKGFVESRVSKNAVHPGMPRPKYVLTGEGVRALQAMHAVQALLQGAPA
jgi:DNA-binding PadR family transcriptional regulator